MKNFPLFTVVALLGASSLHANVIVESRAGGLLFQNYSYTAIPAGTTNSTSTASGTALGLTPGIGSISGGTGTEDQYNYIYRVGIDADNFSPAAGTQLGDNFGVPNFATGLSGGSSGLYNVYATWVVSANVTLSNANFTVTSDGPNLVVGPYNQNTGGTGSPGGNAGWFLLGTVSLTSGNTYKVIVDDVTTAFVGLRMAGVMWEAVPEPSAVALSVLGGVALCFMLIRRRK